MYIRLMETAGKTVRGLPFGEIVLCGERSHGQYPPQKKMRVLPEFVAVYLYEGSGIYQDANQETIELKAGSCLLIPPELPHTYHPHSPTEWSEIFFVFKGSVFHTWQEHDLLSNKTEHLMLRPMEYWLPKFRKPLCIDTPAADTLVNCCRLQSLLSEINHYTVKSQFPEEDIIWLEQAKYRIKESLKTNPSLIDIATELRVSYDHFRKRFKTISGISPSVYRSRIQINQASKLLLETQISITKIAEQLGFCDVFHLSKRFKQATGFSPQQFRKRF